MAPSILAIYAALVSVLPSAASGQTAGPDNLTPPAEVAMRESVSVYTAYPRALVVKALDPWGRQWNEAALTELEIPYAVVRPVAGTIDLDSPLVKVVVVASDQPDDLYVALSAQSERLESFVEAGGVLVAHAFCTGWGAGDWADSPWIPLLSTWTREPTDALTIARLTHPVVASITDGELDNWNKSSVGYFPSLPTGTQKVIAHQIGWRRKPCYVDFRLGYGRVLATLIPMEWPGGPAALINCRFAMLKDELSYALSRAKIREIRWAKRARFINDGVAPNRGKPDETTFDFRMDLIDPGGVEPSNVWLILRRDGRTHAKLRMAGEPGSTARGRVYGKRAKLPVGNYEYCFMARFAEGTDPAPGVPASYHLGPYMSSPPYLDWEGGPGYATGDGVEPNTGSRLDDFVFRVVCRDYEGDMPSGDVKVKLWRGGTPYRTPFPMAMAGSSRSPSRGILYECKLNLPVGSFEYQFLAADDDGPAGGPASAKKGGLQVTDRTTSHVVTALAAARTNAGAQVTFQLSAQAAVAATVMNVAGRPVARICTDRDCRAGTNVLVWDARSDSGLRVPNGLYIVEVTVRGTDGSFSRGTTALRLDR